MALYSHPVTLSWEYLNSRFKYDPTSGILYHKVAQGRVKVGSVAGTRLGSGHLSVRIHGKAYLVHRVIWALYYKVKVPAQVDHEDGDGGNNKILNLRAANNSLNSKNIKLPSNNTSGVIGVSLCKLTSKWRAQICIAGRNTQLGNFVDLFEAVAVRKSAEITNGYHINHGR